MKLFQVRKGQFVYYKNELHKVYSVKPMFKQSVHLYRLKDMQQDITSAPNIEPCRPKHHDTFIFTADGIQSIRIRSLKLVTTF